MKSPSPLPNVNDWSPRLVPVVDIHSYSSYADRYKKLHKRYNDVELHVLSQSVNDILIFIREAIQESRTASGSIIYPTAVFIPREMLVSLQKYYPLPVSPVVGMVIFASDDIRPKSGYLYSTVEEIDLLDI